MIEPIFNLSVEQYEMLSTSGQGQLIYGDKFPPNVNVFKSEKARYEAVLQLYHVVNNVSTSSGASARDIIDFILDYGDTIVDITKDIDSGLITEDDITNVVKYLEGDE